MGTRGPGSYCNLPANENNSELIWSVQYSATAGQFTVGSGNTDFVYFLSFYDDLQGMQRDCNNGRAFRRGRPTLYADNLWQRWTDSTHSTVLDTRYDGTFQSVWYANATTTGACYQAQAAARLAGYTIAGEQLLLRAADVRRHRLHHQQRRGVSPRRHGGLPAGLHRGRRGLLQRGRLLAGVPPGAQVRAHRAVRQRNRLRNVSTANAVGQYDFRRYPTIKKFQDDARPDFNNQDGGRDIIILRLGGVMLDAAEAACAASYSSATCTGSQAKILNVHHAPAPARRELHDQPRLLGGDSRRRNRP